MKPMSFKHCLVPGSSDCAHRYSWVFFRGRVIWGGGSLQRICTLSQASSQGPCQYTLHGSLGNHQGPNGVGSHCCIDTHFIDVETETHRAQDTACTLG